MRRTLHMAVTLAVFAALLLVAQPVSASFPDSDVYIPAVGRGSGSQGSVWYTTVWLSNPGATTADVTVSLLRRDQANPMPEQQQLTLLPGATLYFSDALHQLFGLDSVTGALRFESSVPIVAGARVFNQPGDTVRESQGQLIGGLPARLAVAAGGATDIPGVVQPADGSFRCNFGMVETRGATAQVEVTLYDGAGVEVANHTYSLGPYAAFQRSLTNLAADANVEVGRLHVAVVGGAGAVLAYASAVANGSQSQDPTTLDMNLDAAALGGGGGITGVLAGPGLSGGGSSGDVTLQVKAGDGIAVSSDGVAIAPGGIRADHVAPGQLVLGAKVGGTVLHDVVTLAAGSGVSLDTAGNTVTIAATGGAGERVETRLSAAVTASTPGSWAVGSDLLQLPGAGRWRVGYRVVVQVQNYGVSTLSDPVTVALADLTEGNLVRDSLSVVGLQVGIGVTNSELLTVDGEAVVDVTKATNLAIAGRTSTGNLRLTIHPDDVDLSAGLAAPDAASFLYAERIGD